MSLLGDVTDPQKDAAALQPVLDEAIDRATAGIKQTLVDALDGLTVTITISVTRKQ